MVVSGGGEGKGVKGIGRPFSIRMHAQSLQDTSTGNKRVLVHVDVDLGVPRALVVVGRVLHQDGLAVALIGEGCGVTGGKLG